MHPVDKSQTTHTHSFNDPLSGTTQVSRYHKGKTNLDFTDARDSEWQWHQLGHMQICTSLKTNNHASTPPLSFLQAGCPSCHPTNSVKALKVITSHRQNTCKLVNWSHNCWNPATPLALLKERPTGSPMPLPSFSPLFFCILPTTTLPIYPKLA